MKINWISRVYEILGSTLSPGGAGPVTPVEEWGEAPPTAPASYSGGRVLLCRWSFPPPDGRGETDLSPWWVWPFFRKRNSEVVVVASTTEIMLTDARPIVTPSLDLWAGKWPCLLTVKEGAVSCEKQTHALCMHGATGGVSDFRLNKDEQTEEGGRQGN